MKFSSDLVKIYNSPELDPDASPQSLLNKVQFDIRYYFCRRGNEKMEDMTKDTFKLMFDNTTKIAYVKKVKDEETKNHKETNNNIITGFMPQIIDPSTGHPHRLCPVRSFENYVGHLNPKVERLWQQPLKRFITARDNNVWFKAVPLGHTPLERFMSKLSLKLDLSEYYTNHCIRVTGTSNLFRAHFTPKQIMSVTGHKSLQSLGIYQRVAENEKMMMGMSLMYNLLNPDEVYWVRLLQANVPQQVPALPPIQPQPLQAIASSNPIQPVPQPLPPTATVSAIEDAIPQAVNAIQPATNENLHALDPHNNNILPLDQALVPFNPALQNENENPNALGDIDFLELLNDGNDDEMVLAANQVEKTLTKVTATTTVMKKSSPKLPLQSTFQNCSFGNIGTLNIHIHKH